MILAVIVRATDPFGSRFRFCVADQSGTPAQPYEDKALRRGLRADMHAFRSPGRGYFRALFGQRVFSRRKVAAGLVRESRTAATFNSCGVLRHWSNALLYVCQDAKRGSSDLFKSFAVSLFHARNKAWNRRHEVQRKSVSR